MPKRSIEPRACQNCRTVNIGQQRHCRFCERPLEGVSQHGIVGMAISCSSCGTSLSTRDNFCTECGTKRASSHQRHTVLAALFGGALGIFIGLIGWVVVSLAALDTGSYFARAETCVACDHSEQAIVLILWFTVLSFGGGILAAIAAVVPRLAGVIMIAVAGGMLALAVMAFKHLTQSNADLFSGMGLFFGMGPSLIFLWGGFQTGVFSLLPYSYLVRLGNRWATG